MTGRPGPGLCSSQCRWAFTEYFVFNGVSRATAREALLRLHARGLVELRPGRRARAVVMEQAVRLENLGTALLGEGVTSPLDLGYIADTVVLIRYFEAFGRVRQAASVVKRRLGGSCTAARSRRPAMAWGGAASPR
jgi:hypothetical protein